MPQPEERAQGDGIMNDRIAQALGKLFERSRIVFWYDEKRELRSDFEALALPDVEKIELAGNEFAVKYRILREQPKSRFLIYREGPRPDDLENWLLDVELAQTEFRTDQAAIWLSELGLGAEFSEVVRSHAEFFQAARRKEALKKLLLPDDTVDRQDPASRRWRSARRKATRGWTPWRSSSFRSWPTGGTRSLADRAVCSGRLPVGTDVAQPTDTVPPSPASATSFSNFFNVLRHWGTDGEVKLTADALVFLKRWKDSRQFTRRVSRPFPPNVPRSSDRTGSIEAGFPRSDRP